MLVSPTTTHQVTRALWLSWSNTIPPPPPHCELFICVYLTNAIFIFIFCSGLPSEEKQNLKLKKKKQKAGEP